MMRFHVSYRVRATASEIIEADSIDSAEEQIEAKAYRDDFDPDIDCIDDVDFEIQQMHPVTREGREIWTTYVIPSDSRGHQSALAKSPLFSGVPEQEAALSGAVAN